MANVVALVGRKPCTSAVPLLTAAGEHVVGNAVQAGLVFFTGVAETAISGNPMTEALTVGTRTQALEAEEEHLFDLVVVAIGVSRAARKRSKERAGIPYRFAGTGVLTRAFVIGRAGADAIVDLPACWKWDIRNTDAWVEARGLSQGDTLLIPPDIAASRVFIADAPLTLRNRTPATRVAVAAICTGLGSVTCTVL